MITFTLILISLLSTNGIFGCIMPQHGQQYRIIIAGGVSHLNNRFILATTTKKIQLENTDDGSGNQRWLLNRICDPNSNAEYWHIKSVSTNKFLSVAANNINVNSTNNDTGSGLQRWRIVSYSENDDHWCQIERVKNGGRQYMCAPAGGQYVTTCSKTDTDHRRWFFQASDSPVTCDDTTAPVLSGVPTDTQANCDSIPIPATTICTDNLNECVDAKLSETREDSVCEHSYILHRTWTCTDSCGNTSPPQSQTITVVDTTAPVLSGMATDTEVHCDSIPPLTVPVCTDNCDDDIDALLYETGEDGDCEDSYILNRTWTCSDSCGNKSPPQTQIITVVDTRAPITMYAVSIEISENADTDNLQSTIVHAMETIDPQSDVVSIKVEKNVINIELSTDSDTKLDADQVKEALSEELKDEEDVKNVNVTEIVHEDEEDKSFIESFWWIFVVIGGFIIILIILLISCRKKRMEKYLKNVNVNVNLKNDKPDKVTEIGSMSFHETDKVVTEIGSMSFPETNNDLKEDNHANIKHNNSDSDEIYDAENEKKETNPHDNNSDSEKLYDKRPPIITPGETENVETEGDITTTTLCK